MSNIVVKSFQPKLIVSVQCQRNEVYDQRQCVFLSKDSSKNIMKLVDASKYELTFEASADMRLLDYFHRGIERETFFRLIAQIINAYRCLFANKLPFANIDMNAENIFVNSASGELVFVYVPIDGDMSRGNVKDLLEKFVFESYFASDVDQSFKQELLDMLNNCQSIYTKDLEKYALKYCPSVENYIVKAYDNSKPETPEVKPEAEEKFPVADSREAFCENEESEPSPVVEFAEDSGTADVEEPEGTVVLSESEGTVVLGTQIPVIPSYPKLTRRKTGQVVEVNKPVFRIGKEEGIVDYLVPDNPTVSRSHADIISRDGKYYLYDNNSTNRSYINNILIDPQKLCEITDGAIIRLSNEEFEFRTAN